MRNIIGRENTDTQFSRGLNKKNKPVSRILSPIWSRSDGSESRFVTGSYHLSGSDITIRIKLPTLQH